MNKFNSGCFGVLLSLAMLVNQVQAEGLMGNQVSATAGIAFFLFVPTASVGVDADYFINDEIYAHAAIQRSSTNFNDTELKSARIGGGVGIERPISLALGTQTAAYLEGGFFIYTFGTKLVDEEDSSENKSSRGILGTSIAVSGGVRTQLQPFLGEFGLNLNRINTRADEDDPEDEAESAFTINVSGLLSMAVTPELSVAAEAKFGFIRNYAGVRLTYSF